MRLAAGSRSSSLRVPPKAKEPNDVMTIDYKGHFRLGNYAHCYAAAGHLWKPRVSEPPNQWLARSLLLTAHGLMRRSPPGRRHRRFQRQGDRIDIEVLIVGVDLQDVRTGGQHDSTH